MMRWHQRASFAALLFVLPGLSPPAESQGTVVRWHGFSGGGGGASSVSARLTGSAAQPVAGSATSPGAALQAGFLPGIPAVRRTVVSVPLFPGWNLIANPVQTTEDSVSRLFPGANPPHAFGFVKGVGYALSRRLESGNGYWAKFGSSPSTQAIIGEPRYIGTVPVLDGWNLVGGLSVPLDTGAVQTIPPGQLETQFFGYFGGLVPAAELLPGYGYWVKAAADCQLYLSATGGTPPEVGRPRNAGPLEQWNSISVTDAAGNAQTFYFTSGTHSGVDPGRYEMPPPGPEGTFDVRPASGRMVEPLGRGAGEVEALSLHIRGAVYPLRVRWSIHPSDRGTYMLVAGQEAEPIARAAGEREISDPSIAQVILAQAGEGVPAEFALEQNYPNPFNPSTTIRYALPVAGRATLRIFDMLGREVRTLLDEPLQAEYGSAVWDGASNSGIPVSSGVYIVRLELAAGGASFVAHRRVVLLK